MPDDNVPLIKRGERAMRIAPKCHPNSGCAIHYAVNLRILVLKCIECGSEIMKAKIAESFEEGQPNAKATNDRISSSH